MFPSIPNPNFKLHVGWRNIKTSITAMLVAIVYCLIGRNPAFACIGVIFGLGYDLIFFPQGGHTVFLAVLLGFAIVILILLCSYFWPGGVQPGGVVLCIVLFSTPVDSYIPYALNRILDTSIGVIVALAVNYFLPRERVVCWWEKVTGREKAAK